MVFFVAAVAVVLGETLFAPACSPLLRVLIATAFAASAELAAFHAVHGLAAPLIASPAWRDLFACLAALVETVAGLRLGSAPPGDPDQGEGGKVSGGDLARSANNP